VSGLAVRQAAIFLIGIALLLGVGATLSFLMM
jgi:hypothetical protein